MRILITGGAGFIGSNLVDALLNDERISFVRVLDNLSTGFLSNIQEHLSNPKFEFIHDDIRDYKICLAACNTMNIVLHQAALGSVPRSIKDPIQTNEVNITGTLNVFCAAKDCGVKRVIYAASSSTYGDSKELPKIETVIGKPLSPYAITKYVSELYADVFANLYQMEFIGLRYFNVFGPRQNPNGAYAAVIPLFISSMLQGEAPFINGDGSFSRDFTYINNVIDANLKAIFTNNHEAINQIYNIAYGEQTTLSDLYKNISIFLNFEGAPKYRSTRQGDIPHSLASIKKAEMLLSYSPQYSVKDGLEMTVKWYKQHQISLK